MNAMIPGAEIDEELRKLGEHLDEQPTAIAGTNGSRQSLTEKRGVVTVHPFLKLDINGLCTFIPDNRRKSLFDG